MTEMLERLRAALGEGGVSQQIVVALAVMAITVVVSLVVSRLLTLLLHRAQAQSSEKSMMRVLSALRVPIALSILLIGLIAVVMLTGWDNEEVTARRSLQLALAMALSWGAVRAVEYLVVQRLVGEQYGVKVPRLFQDLLSWMIYVGLFLLYLQMFFQNLSSLSLFFTTSAVLSFIFGLALQETLQNLFSGLAIQFEGSVKLGEWIQFGDDEGQVVGMTWRAVKVRTWDGDYMIVPNSTIAQSELINYSQPAKRHRLRVPIGVHYDTPPGKVKRVVQDVLAQIDGVLEEPPRQVWLVEYADSSINYEIRFWIADYSQAPEIREQVNSLLWYYFKRESITIPFPIRTLDIPPRTRTEEVEERRSQALNELRDIDFLDVLDDEQLETIRKALKPLFFLRGETILNQGEENDRFFIIQHGHVDVSLKREGSPVHVGTLHTGNFFGEHSLFTGEAVAATITAGPETRLVALDRSIFEQILVGHPEAAHRISRVIDERAEQRRQLIEAADAEENEAAREQAAKEQLETRSTGVLDRMRKLFKL